MKRRQQTATRSPAGGDRWAAVLLIAVGVAAFANGLAGPFVFDDQRAIVDNASIRQLWPLTTSLSPPTQSAVAGRPVVNLSLAVNYALGGLSPWGYHAVNLAVHLLGALLLFGSIRRTLAMSVPAERFAVLATPLAFAGALIWLTHPLQTEVIDYVTQRTESIAGGFYLLTLYAAIRAMSPPPGAHHGNHDSGRVTTRLWHVTAVVACGLGMASKESVVTAPLMVLLYDTVFCARGVKAALRTRALFYAALFATWAILAALLVSGPRSHSVGLSAGVTPWVYLLNQAPMIVTYLRLAIWPHALVLDYGLPAAVSLRDVLPSAVLVLVVIGLTSAAWRRSPPLAFLGTWFFVTLSPSSSFVPIATEVGAERRMYLPLAALVVLAVLAAWTLVDSLARSASVRRRRRIAVLGLWGTVAVLAGLTVQRNAEYRNPVDLWQTVVDRRPSGRAHYNLAIELKEAGKREAAIDHYRQALTDNPDAHYALGFELEADGRYDEAIAHYREYIRLRPEDVNVIRAYNLLGRALIVQGQLDEAVDAFRQTLRMQPSNADAHLGIADALAQQERFDEAISEYHQHLRLRPANAAARQHLALALAAVGQLDASADQFREVLRLRPDDAETQRALTELLQMRQGARGAYPVR